MAIYHLHVKVISRGKGRNVVAAAAYRRATKMFDEREGVTFDYQNKSGVIYSEISIPDNSPNWLKVLISSEIQHHSSEKLWNLIEQTEKRIDARLAREIEFALPKELSQEQNIHLARNFIKEQFVNLGMVADWNVHWDENNPHVHVLLTTRSIEEGRFGRKVRDWNAKELVSRWRLKWAEYANYHLSLNNIEAQIDHRSYQEQGIELIPTQHIGRSICEMKKRGITPERLTESLALKKGNLEKIAYSPALLLEKIALQKSSLSLTDLAEETLRYANSNATLPLTKAMIKTILNKIEYHHAVFSDRDLAKALFGYVDDPTLFATAFCQLKNSSQLLFLGLGEDGKERFTTRALFAIENQIQKLAASLSKRSHFSTISSQLNAALEKYQLKNQKTFTLEQKAAISHLLSPSMFSCLVGRAGTGKSFSLAFLRECWEAKGVKVHGIALSGIAADNLKKEAGFKANTIASFLLQAKHHPDFIKKNDVIVMDEAGMCDSHNFLAVMNLTHQAQAKLVLVGDPQQVQPVGPGASFRAILEQVGYAQLQTVYRQRLAWQQQATRDFSQGHIQEALQAYHDHNCIHFNNNEPLAIQHLVSDWFSLRTQHGSSLNDYAVIAHRNQDVATLNQAIRNERIKRQEIDAGVKVNTRQGEIASSVGDRILFLANNADLGVNNGRFADVTRINVDGTGKVKNLVVKLDGSQTNLTIDPLTYSDFTHGYAATVHKTQGITVKHALVFAGGKSWNRHLTYVAMSRHKESCQLYVDKSLHPSFTTLSKRLSRQGLKDSTLDYPYAFSQRRNIEVNETHLKQHLLLRLTKFKDKIKAWLFSLSQTDNRFEITSSQQENKTNLKETPILDLTLNQALLQFVEMELVQNNYLTTLYTLKDISQQQEIRQKIISQGKAMDNFAEALLSNCKLKAEIEKLGLSSTIKLGDLGGYQAIKDRLEQGSVAPQDLTAILQQIKQRASYMRNLSQRHAQSKSQPF